VQVTVNQTQSDDAAVEGVTASKSDAGASGGGAVAATGPNVPAAVKPNQPRSKTPVVKSEEEKVGRNDPCPCGSGKKYKQCHGRSGAAS